MSVSEIIREVERICRKYGVEHLSLFGSWAAGTARPTSDIDEDIENPMLRGDMDRYGKKIYYMKVLSKAFPLWKKQKNGI